MQEDGSGPVLEVLQPGRGRGLHIGAATILHGDPVARAAEERLVVIQYYHVGRAVEEIRQHGLVVLLHRDVHAVDQAGQVRRPAGHEPRIQEDLSAASAPLRRQRAHEPLPRARPAAHPRAARPPGAAGPRRAAAARGEEAARLDAREGGDAAPALRARHDGSRGGAGDQLLEGGHQPPSDGRGADVQQHVPGVRHDDHRGRRYPAEHPLHGEPLVPPAEVRLVGTNDAEGHSVLLQL
mmetsp:Transcript_21755/g.61792  ORF Transcript_21755/g.61792 Transcript_21755/m.61792 type:complete len:238 (-) Transcript_21755:558-1271(-)